MLKRILFTIITCVSVLMISAMPVSAANNCKYSGCTAKPVPGPNRDGYCYDHSSKSKAAKCKQSGCTNNAYHGSSYCSTHECVYTSCKNPKIKGLGVCTKHNNTGTTAYSNSKKTSNSSKKSNSSQSSYDKGYEDVWLDDDYDWDRYYKDDDYARGVDDAMDDEDW